MDDIAKLRAALESLEYRHIADSVWSLCDELEARRADCAAMLRESLERAKALALLEAEARLLQGIEADCREYVARLTAQIEQLGAVPVLPDDYERNAAPRDDAGK